MAENKLKQSELNDEELQDEQLDNANGGQIDPYGAWGHDHNFL